MHFSSELIPVLWRWLALGLVAIAAWASWRLAPWRLLKQVPQRQHLVFAALVTLCLAWSLAIDVGGQLTFHPLLMAATVLLLGASLAVLVGLSALLFYIVLGNGEWACFGVDAICTVLTPVLTVKAALRVSRRISAAPVFVFSLGAGFFGGALSVLASAVASVLLFAAFGQQALLAAALGNAPLLPLLMFPEGFINGALITALVVFQPSWVRLFEER